MTVIDTYLQTLPPEQRAALEHIRQITKELVPDAEETFSYGMPALKYHSKPLLYFAAFKQHLSLFPTSQPTEVLKDKLTDYVVSKGTIRFTVEKPLPDDLIMAIVRERLKEINT